MTQFNTLVIATITILAIFTNLPHINAKRHILELKGVSRPEDLTQAKISSAFKEFEGQFGRHYKSPTEELKRQGIFGENAKKVLKANAESGGKYTLALNEYADLTEKEFVEKILTVKEDKEKPDDVNTNNGLSIDGGQPLTSAAPDLRRRILQAAVSTSFPEYNSYRPGSYSSFSSPSYKTCSSSCDAQKKCKAWSYYGGKCELKSTITKAVAKTSSYSGAKGTKIVTSSTYEFNTIRSHTSKTTKTAIVCPGSCARLCDQAASCKSWSWLGEVCSLFTVVAPIKSSGAAVVGVSGIKNSIDWRKYGLVTPVKNQKNCGSCWAFSTIGTIESIALMKGYGHRDLSEQQLVNCVTQYSGCGGGNYHWAYHFSQVKGLTTEVLWPYVAMNGVCQSKTVNLKIDGQGFVTGGDWKKIRERVKYQPVAVALCASTWQFYHSGVFTNQCTTINHAVNIVGFTDQYWIVKNSWGTGWGESGYIKLPLGNSFLLQNWGAWYPIKN